MVETRQFDPLFRFARYDRGKLCPSVQSTGRGRLGVGYAADTFTAAGGYDSLHDAEGAVVPVAAGYLSGRIVDDMPVRP